MSTHQLQGDFSARNSRENSPETKTGPEFYQDRGADFERLVSMLQLAPDSFVLRLTGGCLNMSEQDSKGLYNLFVSALLNFQGIVLSGATRSVSDDAEQEVRPSIPEIGPMLERYLKDAQHLGLIPGAEIKAQGDGYTQVQYDHHQNRDWNIIAHPHSEKAMVISKETDYLWDSEWQAAQELIQHLQSINSCRGSVIISYDGGIATENELRAAAERSLEDRSQHIILITGSDPQRATDRLSRDAEFLKNYPNVHVVEKDSAALKEKLLDIGCFTNGLSDLKAPYKSGKAA